MNRTLRSPLSRLALLLGLLCAPLASAQIRGTAEAGDNFGTAVATGDFNGDGRDDLAVGVPGETVPGETDLAGAVNVIYGRNSAGLSSTSNQFWSQYSLNVEDDAEPGDEFGSALAAGDFDNDGYDDLAIGVPGESLGSTIAAGVVNVLYGSASGLTATGDQLWHQNQPGVEGVAEQIDRFGASLTAGDFDGDGYDDLAVGVPDERVGDLAEAGAVNVLYGGPGAGLTSTGNRILHLDVPGVTGDPDSYDRFGAALAAGDFDSDGYNDLAVGVPGKNVGAVGGAGLVQVFDGTAAGLDPDLDQVWHQDVSGIADTAESGDVFGAALAAGDFDGSGEDDLAVGVPEETYGALSLAGGVVTIYGHPDYGLSSEGAEFWSQDSAGVPGVAENGDQFGGALGAGDFDNDGRDDLAIGVPFESMEGLLSYEGVLNVLYGSSSYGLESIGAQIWHQDIPNIKGVSGQFDGFGHALAAGDFDNDGRDDLAAGVLLESENGVGGAGAVNVLYGTGANGLSADGDQFWYQGGTGTSRVAGDEEDEGPAAAPEASVTTEAPGALALLPAAPNPFAGQTTLRFTLPAPGAVRLTLYDALGRTVAVLVDEAREAGEHAVAFEAGTLPSGTYLVRLEAGGAVQTQRLTRLR